MTITKPNPGEPITLDINGKQYELRYPLGALKELQTKHKIAVLKGDLGEALRDPEKLGTVLYYGLRTAQPEVTQQWVDDNVDARMLFDLAPVLIYATQGVFPDMEKLLSRIPNVARPTATEDAQAGSTSGPLAGTTSVLPN